MEVVHTANRIGLIMDNMATQNLLIINLTPEQVVMFTELAGLKKIEVLREHLITKLDENLTVMELDPDFE